MTANSNLMNSFVLEFKQGLSNYDLEAFKHATDYTCEKTVAVDVIQMINPELYSRYITKTIEDLSIVGNNYEELDNFYSKIYKGGSLTDKNIAIPLQPEDNVEKIRPEYLANIAIELDTVIKGIIDGSIKESDIKKKYISGNYFDKLKKQLVKTTVVVNDVRDMMEIDDPTIVKVDNTFIQARVIPFVREYPQKVSDMSNIAINVKGRINQSYDNIMNTLASIAKTSKEGNISKETCRLIDYACFNIVRQYMSLVAYVTNMLIRKVSYYSFNMMQYSNLQNTIYNYFPEGGLVLHESVIDGDITEIDDTTLLNSVINNDLNIVLPHIQNAIGKKKMEIANHISRRYNIRLDYMSTPDTDKYPYDTYPYAAANKTIIDIISNIKSFETLLDNTDMVVDDMISQSDLEETFVTKYSNVLSSLGNINFYTLQSQFDKDGTLLISLFNDVSRFENNIHVICTNIHKGYVYLNSLIESIKENNHNFDDNSYNEIKAFLDQIMKNYKDYIVLLTKRLLERLDNLTDTLNDVDVADDLADVEKFVPYNYEFEAYAEAYTDMEIVESEKYTELIKEYAINKGRVRRGTSVVFEADDNQSNNNQNTDNNSNEENQSNRPTVKTDAENQHKENNTNNTVTNNNGQKKESILDKFAAFIRNILDKFTGKTNKLTVTNDKWLASVKAKIQNLDTSNTTISVAPYEALDSGHLASEINTAINKINTINASNLPAELKGDRSKAELYLFPTIPAKLGNDNSFGGRLKTYYTYGKKNVKLSTYSGDDAKTMINNMIEFCEKYKNTASAVESNIKKLSDAASKKQSELINVKSVNESVMYEAKKNTQQGPSVSVQGSNVDASDNINTSNIIISITREYTGSILTVLEKKYLDYINVLGKLAPKDND